MINIDILEFVIFVVDNKHNQGTVKYNLERGNMAYLFDEDSLETY